MSDFNFIWPMAGLGALAASSAAMAWIFSFETRALRQCGLSWYEIIGMPEDLFRFRLPRLRRAMQRASTGSW